MLGMIGGIDIGVKWVVRCKCFWCGRRGRREIMIMRKRGILKAIRIFVVVIKRDLIHWGSNR
ncbi:hypothetical protein, partial [Bacillus subtilis]|uniref:hypothetical protein n=1 Tax=Bacillus subtilis TaxID=1423 RepID=UPI001BDB9944